MPETATHSGAGQQIMSAVIKLSSTATKGFWEIPVLYEDAHLLALDKHTTGDGIISALQVLQATRRAGVTLAELLDGVSLFPQTLLNVRLPSLADWQSNRRLAEQQRAVETELAGQGRVLIRASGTEPVLRVMVEARDGEASRRLAEQLAAAALV